jgi:tetratricopeptide (TPR) repeat protein
MVAPTGSPGRAQNEADPARPPSKTDALEDGENHVQDLILSCNKDGMELLRNGRTKDAFDNFKYAEAILLANQKESDNTSLLAITCNNLGCYYMKVRKFHGALSYLRRALKMEVELKTEETTLAGTHLNLCAILSKLEKPRKAVQHALCALELMHKRISSSEGVVSQDDYATLAVAYHNIGQCRLMQTDAQTSELQQTDQAATAFQTGYQIATRFLGEAHPLSLTLEKNCEAVLRAAKKAKVKSTTTARLSRGETRGSHGPGAGGGGLPDIQSREADTAQVPDMPARSVTASITREAADWANSEEAAWETFAENTLRGTPPPQEQVSITPVERNSTRDLEPLTTIDMLENIRQCPPSLTRALEEIDQKDMIGLPVPQAYDMGNFRFQQVVVEQQLKQTPLGQALEDHPEALMDIIDAEGDGQKSMRYTPNDFRPNRVIKRNTRTSRVVRRTGVFNSTVARDRVMADMTKKRVSASAPWKSAETQKLAAERIQRVWRAWFEYCQETSEWMTVTWICATMIQSHWRSYHVRRKKMDMFAGSIQRHCRGFLVRCVLNKHTAAVTIQRRVVGMITRQKLAHLHKAANEIERLVRGGLARRRFCEAKTYKIGVVTTIQKYIRVWLAKRRVGHLTNERNNVRTKLKATVDLQRMFRGWKGRQLVETRRLMFMKERVGDDAATKIQCHVRRRLAARRVDNLRGSRLDEMERAATFLRKVWLGVRTRKRYLEIMEEFKNAESQVITIQRYVRGFICRLQLWREAVVAEDELWAVMQIQRRWRGYLGRVKAEDKLEIVWLSELGAAKISRAVRGWLAYLRVSRMKRQIARTEFKRARRRYQAAQKIQALTRGVQSRKVTRVRMARVVKAVTHIQCIFRGGFVRANLWRQVENQRSIMIQALVRGYLVRNRRHRLLAKVLRIQRYYRKWFRLSPSFREGFFLYSKHRKAQATKIQRKFRLFSEARRVRLIQDPASDAQLRQRVLEARQGRLQLKNKKEDS